DPSGYGEGQRYLGWGDVTLPAGVNTVSFDSNTFTAPLGPVFAGEVVTATATDPDANTSEFSRALVVVAAPVAVHPIADLTVSEDAAPILQYADLNQVFDDADDPDSALTYTITANTAAGVVTAVIHPNDTLDLSFLANQHGTADITVRATDPAGHIG